MSDRRTGRRWACILGILAMSVPMGAPSQAQVNSGVVPYVFVPGTPISASQVNVNFTTLFSGAAAKSGQTFTGPVIVPQGTVSAPGLGFTSATSSGLYYGSSQVRVAIGGTLGFGWSATQAFGSTGGATAPAYSFLSDSNSGVYSIGDNQIGFATNGTLRSYLTDSGWTDAVTRFLADGSVGAPALSFTGDTDTGFYHATGAIAAAADGAAVQNWTTTQSTIYKNLLLPGLGAATTGTTLVLTAGNEVRPQSSSRRFKTAEARWTGNPRDVLRLTPKTFDYQGGGERGVLGLIAEDAAAVNPLFVNVDAEGRPFSLRDESILAAMVALLQQQQQEISRLSARVRVLERQR